MLQYPLNKMLQYLFAKCYELSDNGYKILASFNFRGMTSNCCCHQLWSRKIASRHADIHVLLSECTVKVVWKYFDLENDGNRVVCRLCKSKKTVTARMNSEHGKMATELTCKLERAEHISIKADGWTALMAESYLTITCQRWSVLYCRLSPEHVGMLISQKNG